VYPTVQAKAHIFIEITHRRPWGSSCEVPSWSVVRRPWSFQFFECI